MAEKYNVALRNVLADAWADQWDGGTLKIYSGAQPSSADDPASGTLLATINLPTPAFGAAANGVVAKAGSWSAVVSTSGTAGWFRMETASGSKIFDGSVGSAPNELSLDVTAMLAGGTVQVNSYSYTQPAS